MESELLLDLQLQKKVEHIFRDKFSCIDKLQKDNETQKFHIQTLNKRVQELEKEMQLLKISQWDAKFFKMWPTAKELSGNIDKYYTKEEQTLLLESLKKLNETVKE